MDLKGVGDRVSIQPLEMRTGLEGQKRIGKVGLARRIVTDSEDPSGSGVTARMRARANSFAQSRQNASAGMDVARTASGALSGVSENLGRMRELAVQAGNGILSDADRSGIDGEFQQLKAGVSQQTESEFNGLGLFSGESIDIVVDQNAQVAIRVQLPSSESLASVATIGVGSAEGAAEALLEIDTVIESVASAQADLGMSESSLGSTLRSAADAEVELASAGGRITGARAAIVEAGLTANDLMRNALDAMQIHQGIDGPQVADLLSAPF